MEQAELSGKTVTTFCTSHSSPLGECAQDLMALKPTGIKWLPSCRFAETLDSNAIAQWLHEIGLK